MKPAYRKPTILLSELVDLGICKGEVGGGGVNGQWERGARGGEGGEGRSSGF
jgi:hypothetical protein